MTYTLKSFNTGQVTLPKKWRDQFSTKHFIAIEKPEGLLIQPLKDQKTETIYYENKEGFGIYSESGINPQDIISQIQKLQNG